MPRKKQLPHLPPKPKPKINWAESLKDCTELRFGKYANSYPSNVLYPFIPPVQNPEKTHLPDLLQKTAHLDLLKGEDGNPLVLYHSSMAWFEKFQPLSFFGTLLSAKNVGFEKACKSEKASDLDYADLDKYAALPEPKPETYYIWYCLQKVQEIQTIPVCLNMKRPLIIPDLVNHRIRDYMAVVVNELKKDTYTPSMKREFPFLNFFGVAWIYLHQKVKQTEPEYEMIFNDPDQMDPKAVVRELQLEKLFAPLLPIDGNTPTICGNISINRVNLMYQRMIRFFERRGYDGFAFPNWTDDSGSMSFICFRPSQVVRLDRKLPARLKIEKPSMAHEKRLAALEAMALQRSFSRSAPKWVEIDQEDYQERIRSDLMGVTNRSLLHFLEREKAFRGINERY